MDMPTGAGSSGSDTARVTHETVLNDPEARQLIDMADRYLDVMGYTNHGISHVQKVALSAYNIVTELGLSQRDAELAAISGLLHDIGNVVHRNGHAQTSGIMSLDILRRMGMPLAEAVTVAGAVGNHDEGDGGPVSVPSAALIIADKCDVIRSRVRNRNMIHWDIHDRVNYAVERSTLTVDKPGRTIALDLQIDTSISQVMEYFEIFLDRMKVSRRAAQYLNCDFRLIMNGVSVT